MGGKTNNSYTRQVAQTVPVTPDDDADLPRGVTRAVYVGGEGDLAVVYGSGVEDVLVGLASGLFHPLSVARVKSTGTTATAIRAGY